MSLCCLSVARNPVISDVTLHDRTKGGSVIVLINYTIKIRLFPPEKSAMTMSLRLVFLRTLSVCFVSAPSQNDEEHFKVRSLKFYVTLEIIWRLFVIVGVKRCYRGMILGHGGPI